MDQQLIDVINSTDNPLNDEQFRASCKQALNQNGVLLLKQFLTKETLDAIRLEGQDNIHKAFYTSSKHNVYLAPNDDSLPAEHPRNRLVTSSKGCITTDQIPTESTLHSLYNNESFKAFLCSVLGEAELHEYADPLSSINLHYAADTQELGWHFDNSSFAITLLIQKPDNGGVFEYRKNARNADANEMNYGLVEAILNGDEPVDTLEMNEGDLVLFRGRNALHRVSPTIGETTRMLVVFAYNSEPGIALSDSARQTFYGRLS